MRKVLALAAVFLAGCLVPEYGPHETEQGKVIQLVYMPSGHGSGTAITMDWDFSVTSVDIPERYGIVFECQHGTFAVEGSKYRGTWQKLKQGETVTILYRKKFLVDGEQRRMIGFDFLDAYPGKAESK